MSGHPQGQYDDGYGQQQHGNDAYYPDEHQGYNDQYDYGQQQHHGGEGYYDEGYVAREAVVVNLAYHYTVVTTMPMPATPTTRMVATTKVTKATRTTTTMTNIMTKALLASNNTTKVNGLGDVDKTRRKTRRLLVTSP